MKHTFLILSFLITLGVSKAQNITGKVYDADTTVKGIRVINSSQNILTVTDNKGNFSISAKVNDTLRFKSLFHHPKAVVLKDIHFESIAVFELEKIVNELDEVQLTTEPEAPVFEEEVYNETLNDILQEDIKNNPHLYSPQAGLQGPNLFALIGMVVKLFKKKKRTQEAPPISYEALLNLSDSNSFFNEQLFEKDLNIPKAYKFLFIEYCEAKQIPSALLTKGREMELLEHLVLASKEFQKFLKDFEKQIED